MPMNPTIQYTPELVDEAIKLHLAATLGHTGKVSIEYTHIRSAKSVCAEVVLIQSPEEIALDPLAVPKKDPVDDAGMLDKSTLTTAKEVGEDPKKSVADQTQTEDKKEALKDEPKVEATEEKAQETPAEITAKEAGELKSSEQQPQVEESLGNPAGAAQAPGGGTQGIADDDASSLFDDLDNHASDIDEEIVSTLDDGPSSDANADADITGGTNTDKVVVAPGEEDDHSGLFD